MSVGIDDLMEALSNVANVQLEYKESFEAYEGYSWDYHGAHIIEKLENAKEKARKLMDKYIDERVEAKIETILNKRCLVR